MDEQNVGGNILELGAGLGVAVTPVWVKALWYVDLTASTVAAVCGAVIAVHAVYRLIKRWQDG